MSDPAARVFEHASLFNEAEALAGLGEAEAPASAPAAALLAQVAAAKFDAGTALFQQERQLSVPRTALARWLLDFAAQVVPLIGLLHESLLAAPVLHSTLETLQILGKVPGQPIDRWIWVRAGGPPGKPIALFDYSGVPETPLQLFAGMQGVLLTDGSGVYDALAQQLQVVQAGCFGILRQQLETVGKLHRVSPPRSKLGLDPRNQLHVTSADARNAKRGLELLRQLEAVEKPLWNDAEPVSAAHRVQVRSQLAVPILEELRAWLEAQPAGQSLFAGTVQRTLRKWPQLLVFLTHGAVPIENQLGRAAGRPFRGDKGWVFSENVPADASARLYSLIQTAKAGGVEPQKYLALLFERVPQAQTREALAALLPWSLCTG